MIVAGGGHDSVSGAGGFFDLGDGNDSLKSCQTGDDGIHIRASRGDDSYELTGGNLLLDYSQVGKVDMSISRQERSSTKFSYTATKESDSGTDTDRGTWRVTNSNNYAVDIYTGDEADSVNLTDLSVGVSSNSTVNMGAGNDTLTISGESDGLSITMGKGNNKLNFEDNINLHGVFSLNLQDGERTRINSAQKQALSVSTSDVRDSMTVDLGAGTATVNNQIMLRWNNKIKTEFTLNVDASSDGKRADTLIGSSDDDRVFLGYGDCANLGGGDDEVFISAGHASVNGEAGHDKLVFDGCSDVTINVRAKRATFKNMDGVDSTIRAQNFEEYIFQDGTFIGSNADERLQIMGANLNSTITGGGGNDTFTFLPSSGNIDFKDFNSGDKIDLSDAYWANLNQNDCTFTFQRLSKSRPATTDIDSRCQISFCRIIGRGEAART
jgi:hypothetical protein